MKKTTYLIIAVLFLFSTQAYTQVVDGINYQAVAIDENGKEIAGIDINGNIISSQAINVRFTIISNSIAGEITYQETHLTNTDQYGLFSVIIGHGEVTSLSPNSSILDIAWGEYKHYLQVEIDFKGFGDYQALGTQQLMAVPYALYALNTDYGNISNVPTNLSDFNNDGPFITSPIDDDSDPTNEIQSLSISNDTIFLTDGGFVKLPEESSGTSSITNSTYRIGFEGSTTWICPEDITEITVQLWGGSGGGGGSDYLRWNGVSSYEGCVGSTFISSGKGGDGGNGGYNKSTITVVPGQTYYVNIGHRGSRGNRGWQEGSSPFYHATHGTPGGSSSFHGILFAEGGTRGEKGYSSSDGCTDGANGIDGAIVNYSVEYLLTAGSTQSRSYVPVNYTTTNIAAASYAIKGTGGASATMNIVNQGVRSGIHGTDGEAGYCVISW